MSSEKPPKWTQGQLTAALQYYHTHKGKESQRSVAAAFGIPKSTFSDYVSGKVEVGSRPGPPSVLTKAEEDKLVDYCLHMAKCGYGRTREQVCLTVKKFIDRDGRPNPFEDNMPGRKWWDLFKKRHPEISLQRPMPLQLCRAQSCTSEVLSRWYSDFDQFLQTHNLKDRPSLIWNADETGVSLCPKTGKVVALKSSRHVYTITGNSKEQITTLCAANAAGDVVPPMHIFPGERFKSNPMEGCVDRAFFGRSPNGWISTELFYGWVANHFSKFATERPCVLIVDGHSTHIDLEVSKLCRDLQIHLYCLPPHTSHVLQPLDVGFFGAFKASWGKAFESYKFENPGMPLTKYTFAPVFKKAWLDCVKASTIVNSFKESGLCPLNPNAISSERLAPSQPLSAAGSSTATGTTSSKPSSTTTSLCQELEKLLKPETLRLYQTRAEEQYDVVDDELYSLWKSLRVSTSDTDPQATKKQVEASAPQAGGSQVLPKKQQRVSPFLDEVLTYPKPKSPPSKKKGKSTATIPKHLSSAQAIDYFQQRKDEKEAEAQKVRNREERERKKKEKEEKARKKQEAEKAKAAKAHRLQEAKKTAAKKKTSKGGKRGASSRRRREPTPPSSPSDDEEQDHDQADSHSDVDCCCPVCGLPENDVDRWIACDSCQTWYHVHCVDLDGVNDLELEGMDWICFDCV